MVDDQPRRDTFKDSGFDAAQGVVDNKQFHACCVRWAEAHRGHLTFIVVGVDGSAPPLTLFPPVLRAEQGSDAPSLG
ncbi:hypothetical protein BJP08_08125 [Corynebacterium sp. NML140438]|nr:hypothetical protein BJP08_08125 [Corynebacterium sp. NML140438]